MVYDGHSRSRDASESEDELNAIQLAKFLVAQGSKNPIQIADGKHLHAPPPLLTIDLELENSGFSEIQLYERDSDILKKYIYQKVSTKTLKYKTEIFQATIYIAKI